MADRDLERLDSGITIEQVRAPQFYTFHDRNVQAWQDDQPVIDGHAQVGKLVIDPDLLERATWEVKAQRDIRYYNFHDLDETYSEEGITTFLHRFVQNCHRRFTEIVRVDAQNYPNKKTMGAGYIQLGPYTPRLETIWHTDRKTTTYLGSTSDETPTDITYTLRIIGEPTVYSAQHHRQSDLNKKQLLIEPPAATATYAPKIVAVHHRAMAPHAGPDEAHARLFMNYSLYRAFDQNNTH